MGYFGYIILAVVVLVMWLVASGLRRGTQALAAGLVRKASQPSVAQTLCTHCSRRSPDAGRKCQLCTGTTTSSHYRICHSCANGSVSRRCESCADIF